MIGMSWVLQVINNREINWQRITAVIRIHPLEVTTICTRFCGNPSSRYWYVLQDKWELKPAENCLSQRITKGIRTQPIAVERFQSGQKWWTGLHLHPQSHAANMVKKLYHYVRPPERLFSSQNERGPFSALFLCLLAGFVILVKLKAETNEWVWQSEDFINTNNCTMANCRKLCQ